MNNLIENYEIILNNLKLTCADLDSFKQIRTSKLSNWEQKLKDTFSFKNYLYQSVYNEFINQHRKKNALLTLEENYIKTLNTILKEEGTRDLTKLIALVKQEIQTLPPKCKEIFILGKQEGLTYTEIAKHLNIF